MRKPQAKKFHLNEGECKELRELGGDTFERLSFKVWLMMMQNRRKFP